MWHTRNSLRICVYVLPVWSSPLSVLPLSYTSPSPFARKIVKQHLATVFLTCGKKNVLNTWGLLRLSALSNQAWNCSFLLDVQSNIIVCMEFYFALTLWDFNTTASNQHVWIILEAWHGYNILLNVSFEFQCHNCCTISPLGNLHLKNRHEWNEAWRKTS